MTTAKKQHHSGEKRQFATVPVARLLQRLLTPEARRRGFAETAVLADWPAIVGRHLAQHCQPVEIRRRSRHARGGTLVIRAPGAMTLELQHTAPQLIERVNSYFGYRAIVHVRLVQGPIDRSKVKVPEPPLAKIAGDELEGLREKLAGVHDGPLRQALEGLGVAIKQRRRRG